MNDDILPVSAYSVGDDVFAWDRGWHRGTVEHLTRTHVVVRWDEPRDGMEALWCWPSHVCPRPAVESGAS